MGDGRLLELGTETYTNLVEYRLCYLMVTVDDLEQQGGEVVEGEDVRPQRRLTQDFARQLQRGGDHPVDREQHQDHREDQRGVAQHAAEEEAAADGGAGTLAGDAVVLEGGGEGHQDKGRDTDGNGSNRCARH